MKISQSGVKSPQPQGQKRQQEASGTVDLSARLRVVYPSRRRYRDFVYVQGDGAFCRSPGLEDSGLAVPLAGGLGA